MAHDFTFLQGDKLVTYTRYEDIPEDPGRIVRFVPELPEGEFDDDQLEEKASWNEKLQKIMERYNARRL